MNPTTVVLGASPKEDRYSNRAVRKLVAHGHSVIAVGLRSGNIDGTTIVPDVPLDRVVDTVTMYLNAENQRTWEERILALKPRRIIFNPGAENERLADAAARAGISVQEACTLVLLSTGQY